MTESINILPIVGKTIASVHTIQNNNGEDVKLHLITDDGSEYVMWHEQDCCESVYIESVVGDLQSLIGNLILEAFSISQKEENPSSDASATWTFFKFATIKGWVDIRWLGESNGYYSEDAEFGLAISRKEWEKLEHDKKIQRTLVH